MVNEYFNLIHCDHKNNCENVNSQSCNRCLRNKIQRVDNFKEKSYNFKLIEVKR
jgi:hypothetical protein